MSFEMPMPDHDDPRWTRQGAVYVPNGEGPTSWVGGDTYTIKAGPAQSNGTLTFIEATVPPGAGPVAHVHNANEEAFYLLSGELEFLDGDRTFMAAPGDFVLVPRGTRHRFFNVGRHAAKLLFLFTPSGPDSAFDVIGVPAVPATPPPPLRITPDLLETMLRVSAETNTELMPEPPPAQS